MPSKLIAFALIVSVASIYSRGIFELYLSKNIGYIFGVAGCLLFLCVAVIPGILKERSSSKYVFLAGFFLFLYAFIALVSIVFSLVNGVNWVLAFIYTMAHVMLMLGTLLTLVKSKVKEETLLIILLVLGSIISISGLLEYFGVVEFPGSWEFGDYSRIAGSLGSKQHYGYASAFVGMSLLFLIGPKRNSFALFIGMLCIVMSFISMTRNGLPIIAGGVALLFGPKVFSSVLYLRRFLLVVFLFIASMHLLQNDLLLMSIDRLVSIFSTDELSNNLRVEAWRKGVNVILNGAVLVGTDVGLYSQAGDRLGLANSMHFESTVLQQFANYGLLGGVSFILFFSFFIMSLRKRPAKILALMMFLNYFYYPGGESLPFTASWFLLAAIDKSTHKA